MNKIVRQHVSASEVPERLREGIDPSSLVTVVVEEEPHQLTREELKALTQQARQSAKGITTEEAVARVRELRDEWND